MNLKNAGRDLWSALRAQALRAPPRLAAPLRAGAARRSAVLDDPDALRAVRARRGGAAVCVVRVRRGRAVQGGGVRRVRALAGRHVRLRAGGRRRRAELAGGRLCVTVGWLCEEEEGLGGEVRNVFIQKTRFDASSSDISLHEPQQ